jgi:transitional endoplasmic reticulum ATPase
MTENESTTARDKNAILAKLHELGGNRATADDAVVREGTKFVIPASVSLKEASRHLAVIAEQQEAIAEFKRTFNFRPWDGAICTFRALKKIAGAVGHKGTNGFFGPNPPEMIEVETGPGETTPCPWGIFTLADLEGGEIHVGGQNHPELGPIFEVTVYAKRKDEAAVQGLFACIQHELENHSVYRGKALDGGTMPGFLDLRNFDPSRIVYSGDCETQLEAQIWQGIRYTAANRKLGLAVKRAVLLHGPYGTGKSLAAKRTAQICTENGWTFLFVRPGKDDYKEVLRTARMYQPAVVFVEDADTIAGHDQASGVSELLDVFDGITSKDTEIVVVMTTNHPERIHKGMVRPGRLDAVIEVGPLDAAGIEKLVRLQLPENLLDADVDFAPVCEAMKGYMPAFIVEATSRAIRYALDRTDGDITQTTIGTDDLVFSANGLRKQLTLMEEAQDDVPVSRLDTAFGLVLGKVIEQMLDNRFMVEAADNVEVRI